MPSCNCSSSEADPHLFVRRCRSCVPGRGLLRSVRNPALMDQVRVNVVHVLLAQEIIKTLHARWREYPLQYDILELRMQTGIEFAQVGRTARPKHMAA